MTKKKLFLPILTLILIVVCVYIYAQSQIGEKITSFDNGSQTREIPAGKLATAMGFSFRVPQNWTTNHTNALSREKIVFTNTLNSSEIIEINEFKATEFDEFYGGLGKYTLEFDTEQNCWLVTRIPSDNITTSQCVGPVTAIDDKPVFLTHHKTVVIPVSPYRFIYFTSPTGSQTILEDFVLKADLDFF